MTQMARAQDNEVLAFLLGSTPILAVETENDPPELESVSDSDMESNATEEDSHLGDFKDETGQSIASDAAPNSVDSPPEETESLMEKQNAGEICKEDSGSKSSVEDNIETEHEDDCVASMTDDATQQPKRLKEKAKLKEETQVQQKSNTRATMKVKTTKARRGSARSTKAVAPIMTSKDLSTEAKLEQAGNMATFEEILFVGCVTVVLVAYLIACVYIFFHPLVLPLPDYEELYSAYDISNVSVHIVNPVEDSQVTPQGVLFEWKLASFPKEALHLYGAEVFRYQVSLDNEVIASEIEFLAIEEEDIKVEVLNHTVRFPIPLRKFDHGENDATDRLFKLHLDVTIPIPGLIEDLKTFEQDVYVRKPPTPLPDDGVHLRLTSPTNGTIFELNQSIVLEYTAVNVDNMEVLLDNDVHVKKTYVTDGNLLLRGLGTGPHKFEIRAMDEQNMAAAASSVHVHVQRFANT